jgi:hypothetical protein
LCRSSNVVLIIVPFGVMRDVATLRLELEDKRTTSAERERRANNSEEPSRNRRDVIIHDPNDSSVSLCV